MGKHFDRACRKTALETARTMRAPQVWPEFKTDRAEFDDWLNKDMPDHPVFTKEQGG